MRCCKRIIAGIMVSVVFMSAMFLTVNATEPTTEPAPEETTTQKLEREAAEIPIESNALKGWPQGPVTHGEAAIVMEAGTGAILYAKNMDAKEYPASITKLLTVLVALQNGTLTDNVSISADCVSFLEPGDASIGLKEGENITLEQALYATLLASANEAAYAVAENVGKNAGHDYNWFIEQMNETCRLIGAEHSSFANPNGLHMDNHYTCARDMALISKELFKYPEFFQIVQTYEYKIPASEISEERVFQQNHKMLIEGYADYYELAIAGKTGYTDQALSTLTTMADNGEVQLICVVLKTYGINVYPDTRGLFDYAFANFKKTKVAGLEKSEDIDQIIEDEGGRDGYVMLPDGIDFKDLDMEMSVENGQSREAVLSYSYQGYPMGSARATLSKTYIEKHTAKVKTPVKEKQEDAKTEVVRIPAVAAVGAALLAAGAAAVYGRYLYRKRKKNRRKSRRKRRE